MRFVSIIVTVVGFILAGIILLPTGLLIFIQSVAGNQRLLDQQAKALTRLIPAGFGIRIRTSGLENVDSGKAMVFMSNHVNIFDPIILYGHIPNFIRGVELEDHFKWPVWGFIIRRLGNIPISHSNMTKALESLENAHKAIEAGTSIAILPEGHRTRDGELGPFRRGPFRLAKNAGADIVPVAMKGLWARKTVHSLLVTPGRVEMIFGKPVSANESEGLSERELRDKVKNVISGMLEDKTV